MIEDTTTFKIVGDHVLISVVIVGPKTQQRRVKSFFPQSHVLSKERQEDDDKIDYLLAGKIASTLNDAERLEIDTLIVF